MGMESYYITLKVNDLMSKDSLTQLFVKKYDVSKYKIPSGKLFKKYIVDNNRFVIDNKAVVSITEMKFGAEITLELCFANFESNLAYIYDVIQWCSLLGKATRLKVLTSEYELSTIDYEKFRSIVSQSFCAKISQFTKHYGNIEADILPNNFYNWIRRTGINRRM